jgi:hypothetical protein
MKINEDESLIDKLNSMDRFDSAVFIMILLFGFEVFIGIIGISIYYIITTIF